jgi:hypothetical protein
LSRTSIVVTKSDRAELVIIPQTCGIKLKYGQNTANQSQKGSDTVALFIRDCIFSIITLFQSLLEEFYYVFNTFDYRTGA